MSIESNGSAADLLKKCEAEIRKGQEAFLTTARAVFTIRRQKLYQPNFKTASAYFAEKWEMSPADVSRYLHAAEVLKFLETKGCEKLPENEAQARALYEIRDDDKRLQVWDQVSKSGDKITAKKISELATPAPTLNAFPSAAPQSLETDAVPRSKLLINDLSPTAQVPDDKQCTAVVEIEMDSSALMDAAEYRGIPCEQIGEKLYSVMITEMDRASLFHHLATWETVYLVRKITITFE